MTDERKPVDFARFAFRGTEATVVATSPNKDSSQGPPSKKRRADIFSSSNTSIHYSRPSPDCSEAGLCELYTTPSQAEKPLKLIIVGHNPSSQSWTKGHYYANPSNRMWPLLVKAGIVPSAFTAQDDQRCPAELGVGFTDIMTGVPETNSSSIPDATVQSHKHGLFERLQRHVQRCHAVSGVPLSQCCPRVIAFAGVRQWKALFPDRHFEKKLLRREGAGLSKSHSSILNHFSAETERGGAVPVLQVVEAVSVEQSRQQQQLSGVSYGLQTERPEGWPPSLRDSLVFLLPSSSGAAAMTSAQREGPYLELGNLLLRPEYEWVPQLGLGGLPRSEVDPAAVAADGRSCVVL